MSFHVSENGTDENKVILLEDVLTGTKAEIYTFGALLNAFSIQHSNSEKNIIDGFQNMAEARNHITPLFRSAKLSPFVCRLREGRYTFANNKYKIEKYYNLREAIHGLIYDAVFTVKEKGANDNTAFVILTYDYNKADPGFPFFYRITITYELQSGNHLTIITKVTNLSASAMPLADGWHPYFCFGKKANNLQLFMNTKEIAEFDNRLLPTGRYMPYTEFIQPHLIEDTCFDNCFVLNEADSHAACIITDIEDHLQLSIYPDKNYPYLQVFIPEHRNSIAIENLSSLPDSFNNTAGLLILEPSQSHHFTTSYVVSSQQSASSL